MGLIQLEVKIAIGKTPHFTLIFILPYLEISHVHIKRFEFFLKKWIKHFKQDQPNKGSIPVGVKYSLPKINEVMQKLTFDSLGFLS